MNWTMMILRLALFTSLALGGYWVVGPILEHMITERMKTYVGEQVDERVLAIQLNAPPPDSIICSPHNCIPPGD